MFLFFIYRTLTMIHDHEKDRKIRIVHKEFFFQSNVTDSYQFMYSIQHFPTNGESYSSQEFTFLMEFKKNSLNKFTLT